MRVAMSHSNARGAAAVILVLIAGCASLFAQPATSTVRMTFDPRQPTSAAITGKIVLRSATDESVAHEVPLAGNGASPAEAPGTAWNVRLISPGWWTPETYVVFPAADTSEARQVRAWRTGIVSGTLKSGERDLTLPSSIKLVVESPPQPSRPPEIARGTSFDCAVNTEGKWSCEIPATALDLVLRHKGFTPHYRWGVAVSAAKPLNIGTFVLRRGASFVAWLDRDTLKSLKHPARARLVRFVSTESALTLSRLSVPVAEAPFNDRGVVQLAPLPPGLYVLEVRSEGFAPARIPRVEIFAGSESTFRTPIPLRPPIEIVVTVEPPTDPNGDPWQLDFERDSDLVAGYDASAAVHGRVDAEGTFRVAAQEPGTFTVVVRDRSGNRVSNDSYEVTETNASIRIKLEQHTVDGTVYLGERPLKADLFFGGEQGAERVVMHADDDGKFRGTLPRAGEWHVGVLWSDPPVRSQLDVTVPAAPERLVVRLPDNVIAGFATDATGRRLTSGSVILAQPLRALVTRLSADGTFTFRGLPAGSVELLARDRSGASSATAKLTISDSSNFDGVELRINASRQVAGLVVAGDEPAIGVQITAAPLGVGTATIVNAFSDDGGRFSMSLPEATRRALFTVAAPGRTLQSFDVVIGDAPIRLVIAPAGGLLEVSAGPPPFTLTRDGVPVYINDLLNWMRAHGDSLHDLPNLRVPDVAPGRYELCAPRNGSPKCVAGALAPGGSLRLAIPD
ncbi:MAG: hypothetical protein QOI24_2472 [Acidobacteriota bacterium]|jgi:hypothetical protein|nr:hypothetical protein [Acidobacteriota bacterium]